MIDATVLGASWRRVYTEEFCAPASVARGWIKEEGTTVPTSIRRACLAALAMAAGIVAAENPFVGAWKLNPAKSKFTGETVKFERTASGAIQFSGGGLTYTFKVDGREYPAPLGSTAAWKQLDERTWEVVDRLHGKVISTDTIKLSPDGKTRTVISKGTKPNGETFQDTAVYERVSGESGLLGTWRSTQVKISSPSAVQIAAHGENGLTVTVPAYEYTCNAKFDGKDYAPTGPTVPAGLTLTLKRTGERTMEIVEKDKGKPLGTSKFTVSADGKTLTEVYTPAAVNEPVTAVYERQ